MRFRGVFSDILRIALVASLGCARPGAGPSTAPAPERQGAELPAPAELPPIPMVTGPINVRVVYPQEGQVIQARDSNFILGSVGSGGVALTIDGRPVEVRPNGAFLAFLPVPRADSPAYQLVVTRGRDTVRVTHRVGVLSPRPVLGDTDPLAMDAASVQPSPRIVQQLRASDPVRVSVRATKNASVVLRLSSGVDIALHNLAADMDTLPNALSARGGSGGMDPALWSTDVSASMLGSAGTMLVARRGADSVTVPGPRVTTPVDALPQYVVLGTAPGTMSDTDRVVIGKPVLGGTYKWFLLPGTIVEQTGRVGESIRVQLDRSLDVWVDAAEATPLARGTAAPRRVTANARVIAGPNEEWSDVVIPMTERPPYAIDEGEEGGQSITLTLYGTQANTDIVNFATAAGNVARVSWEQVANDRARYTIHLTHAPYGYLVRWERGALVVRVRRPPAVDRERPLTGLTITVDAGHPPAGSTGPTGLYEAVATLAIAQRVSSLLEARGARVVMTRTAPGAVALAERPVLARRANAHAFVSLHLNALPDGVNPFTAHGTGTYYFNGHSVELARQVQRGMVQRMGLRDLGTNYDNLAVLRPTWMPAVLCEGAFVIIPEQEAALRTPEFQQRYAEGVVDGLEAYFRGIGRQGAGPKP